MVVKVLTSEGDAAVEEVGSQWPQAILCPHASRIAVSGIGRISMVIQSFVSASVGIPDPAVENLFAAFRHASLLKVTCWCGAITLVFWPKK